MTQQDAVQRVVRLLALRFGVHAAGAHERNAALHRVEEQPHVLHQKHAALPLLRRLIGGRGAQSVHIGLCRGDVHALVDHEIQRPPLRVRVRQAQQGAGVALAEPLRPQPVQHVPRQAQQPQLVRHGALALAEAARRLLLAEPEQADELPDALRLLHKVEIAALDVLDQRDDAAALHIHVHDDAGHLAQPRHPRRAQPPLPRDQLEAVPLLAHGQRLQDAVLGDGIPQLLQTLPGKMLPRLQRPRHDLLHRDIAHPLHDPPLRRAVHTLRLLCPSFPLILGRPPRENRQKSGRPKILACQRVVG